MSMEDCFGSPPPRQPMGYLSVSAEGPYTTVQAERDRYRAALERIANADMKRCSAGWLQQIAEEALK